MTINTYAITNCTLGILSKLEQRIEINDNEIITSFKTLLHRGKTYEALEIAIALEKNKVIPTEILTDIAYLHYIKMVNSHLNSKTINDFVSKYPGIKEKKDYK